MKMAINSHLNGSDSEARCLGLNLSSKDDIEVKSLNSSSDQFLYLEDGDGNNTCS